MKKIFFLLLGLIFIGEISFANVPTNFIKKETGTNIRFDSIPQSTDAKYQALLTKALDGDAEAMYHIAKCYFTGLYVKPNLMQSIEWFEKSAKAGYGAAWTELGDFYKYGLGKKKDYAQAYEYFVQASKLAHPTGVYSQGYMLYKGFGVEQNYEAAVQVFQKGVTLNSPGSMYMLGLCYRNGFGIEMNLDSARNLLLKAQELGSPLATDELLAENAEYNPKNALLSANISEATNIAAQSDFSIETYTPIANAVKAEDLNNEYKGYIIKYDWSGKKIIEAVELELSLYTPDSTTFGIWGEKGRRHKLLVNATCLDNGIVFNNNKYRRPDHYHALLPLINRFQTANLKRVDKGENSYLVGNLVMYVPYLKEPQHPISIVLAKTAPIVSNGDRRQAKNTSPSILKATEKTLLRKMQVGEGNIKEATAYPNPFDGRVTIEFYLNAPSEASVKLTSVDGKVQYNSPSTRFDVGDNSLELDTDLPAGMYFVTLQAGNETKTLKLIKQ